MRLFRLTQKTKYANDFTTSCEQKRKTNVHRYSVSYKFDRTATKEPS